MRIRKNMILILVTILLLSFVLTACGDGKKEGSTSSEDIIKISYGHGFMPETPHHKAAIKFKEEVEEATDGRVQIDLFPSGELGSAREMFEGLQMATQEIALVPTARISGFAPELQLFDLPYLFPSRDALYDVMDGEIGTELLDNLQEQKIKGVAFYEDGYKQLTADRELRKVEDFNGVKFRTMESPIVMAQFKALGANPTPIDFAELYNSLKLGVVDGQENPLVTIENMKFYEVQDYLMLTEHAYLGHVLLFGGDWFESLPEDIQDVLYTKGREIAKWQRQAVQDEEVKYLETIKEYGTNIVELTDEEQEALKEATLPVHQEYIKLFGDELLNKVYDAVK